jgi:hypothetical protein
VEFIPNPSIALRAGSVGGAAGGFASPEAARLQMKPFPSSTEREVRNET